jgi:ACS family hexuronate transporter-like MFS transporter
VVDRRTAWLVSIVATLTMTVSYIDRATFSVLAPTVTKALHINETQYGLLQSAFAIAYLVGTPVAGWWIDRVGARRGLVGSILLWTSVAALHALAPTFGVLFMLRIALGLAEGPGFPGAAQTMHRVLPPADRERGFGVLFTGSSIGGMIAPLLAGFLFGLTDSWRLAFLGTALVGLVWVPIWIGITSMRRVRAELDAPPEVLPKAQIRHKRPAFFVLVLQPNMVRSLAAIFAVAPITGFAVAWGAKYLVAMFAIPQKSVGHFLWMPPVVFDVGAILFGDLASRQRRPAGQSPRLLFGIGVLLAMTLALLPFAQTPWQSMSILGIAMAGGGAIYAIVTADLLSRVPREQVSFAGGILAGAQSLAHVIISPLVGMTVDHYKSYDVAAVALGIWVIPGTTFWLLRRAR